MKTFNCLAIFPFRDEQFKIYTFLKELMSELSKEYDVNIQLIKGNDETALPHDEKIIKIEKYLQKADFVIADLTGLSSNVIWEVGFATALKKNILYICQNYNSKEVPFNLQRIQIISYNGGGSLKKELKECIKASELIEKIKEEKSTIFYDDLVNSNFQAFSNSLRKIKKNSILSNLAIKEIERYTKRISKLEDGYFELRNEKPKEEIIEYYSNYVSLLNNNGCTYQTISHFRFWKEITDDGTNFNYLSDNEASAKKGTLIQRVFIVNQREHKNKNVSSNPTFKKILQNHFEASKRVKNNKLKTRLYFTPDYEDDLNTYKNLAIWKKEHEILVFYPLYNEFGKMIETRFYYHNSTNENFKDSRDRANRASDRFDTLWEAGEELESKHFEDLQNEK